MVFSSQCLKVESKLQAQLPGGGAHPWKQCAASVTVPELVLRAYSIWKCSKFYLSSRNLDIICKMMLFLLVYMCVCKQVHVRSYSSQKKGSELLQCRCRQLRGPSGVGCTGAGGPGDLELWALGTKLLPSPRASALVTEGPSGFSPIASFSYFSINLFFS